jgi:uncharacterized protein YggE
MRQFARLASIAVALALISPAIAVGQTGTTTLHVVGHGRAFVTPDVATVSITVTRSAATRQLARERANRVVSRMVSGLVGIGIARKDIQTSAITLNSTTATDRHRRRHTTYHAEIDLTVTVTRIRLLSPLLDVASRTGADSFAGPNFGFSDPSAGLQDASAAAIADARRRADAAAAQLGMHVVAVQSVDLDPQSQPLPGTGVSTGQGQGGSTAPKPVTPVLPGRQEVDAAVDVVYLVSG